MANKIKQLKLYKNSSWSTYTISPDAADVNLTVAIGATASNVQDALHTLDAEKAPKNHAYTTSMFGLGDNHGVYGHVSLTDSLTSSVYADGEALAAHQGYVLNTSIGNLNTSVNSLSTAISSKAPTKHASSTYDEYGVATASNYGHALVKNGFSTVHSTGQALSAYQGYVLDNKIAEKAPISHASTTTDYGTGTPTSYGHVKVVHSPADYTAGQALSAYGAKLLLNSLTSTSSVLKATTFAGTNPNANITTASALTGVYEPGSRLVRIFVSFCGTATNTKLATNASIFTVPTDYRPSVAAHGHLFAMTTVSTNNSSKFLIGDYLRVNTSGSVTQIASANTNRGIGYIEYTV